MRFGGGLELALALALLAGILAAVAWAARDDTLLVSRASGATGVKGNGFSQRPDMSSDGRYVAFESAASNLHPDDPDGAVVDVFVRDLQANTATLVSRATGAASVKGNGSSRNPAISSDGRYVVFMSEATNLHADDAETGDDIFIRDLQTDTTTLVSRATGAGGVNGNNDSDFPAVSADGRFVAFHGSATNLHPDDGDLDSDVFVRDLQASTTTLASRANGVAGVKGNGASTIPSISADGSVVAFQSGSSNLHPDLTTLKLTGFSFARCRSRGKRASAAAKRRLSRRTVRRLRSDATGRFRTRGRHSSATVRGTEWETIDRCDGTLTRVRRGRVVVRDFRRRKTVTVKAGKRYLARPRR